MDGILLAILNASTIDETIVNAANSIKNYIVEIGLLGMSNWGIIATAIITFGIIIVTRKHNRQKSLLDFLETRRLQKTHSDQHNLFLAMIYKQEQPEQYTEVEIKLISGKIIELERKNELLMKDAEKLESDIQLATEKLNNPTNTEKTNFKAELTKLRGDEKEQKQAENTMDAEIKFLTAKKKDILKKYAALNWMANYHELTCISIDTGLFDEKFFYIFNHSSLLRDYIYIYPWIKKMRSPINGEDKYPQYFSDFEVFANRWSHLPGWSKHRLFTRPFFGLILLKTKIFNKNKLHRDYAKLLK